MSFGDLLGWCLAFLLPIFALAGPLRRDQGAAHAYLLAVFLHIAAAAIYVYLPGVLPARGDAIVFHKTALSLQYAAEWSFGLSSLLFKWALAHVYSLVGPSFFFASVLSVYAFAASVVVLAKLMELLDIQDGKGIVIFLFGALPTAVLYGSVPLREPYQVLFFMLACYCMLKFRLTSQPLHLVASIMFALLMGLLHKGLIVYAPFLITIMLFVRVDYAYLQSRSPTRNVWFHRFTAVALTIGFIAVMSTAVHDLEGVHGTDVLSSVSSDGLTDAVAEHRDEASLSKGRTAYGVALDTSSPLRIVYSAIKILFYYMFTPFPWKIRNSLDVYAFGEVALRVAALIAIFRMWREKRPIHPHVIALLMVVYVSMAFLWAAGTANYGTATRHHMVHQWILLLLGVPALIQMRSGFAGARPTAQRTRLARSRSSCVKVRVPHLRPLVDVSSHAPRLVGGWRRTRGLQVPDAAPRLPLSALARPRRLTDQ